MKQFWIFHLCLLVTYVMATINLITVYVLHLVKSPLQLLKSLRINLNEYRFNLLYLNFCISVKKSFRFVVQYQIGLQSVNGPLIHQNFDTANHHLFWALVVYSVQKHLSFQFGYCCCFLIYANGSQVNPMKNAVINF